MFEQIRYSEPGDATRVNNRKPGRRVAGLEHYDIANYVEINRYEKAEIIKAFGDREARLL